MTTGHEEAYARWQADPVGFWAEAATAIDWYRPWEAVLDRSAAPLHRWFRGGVLNTCYNALDRHVEAGRGSRAALVYDSPVTGTIEVRTYSTLRDEVARFAGVLVT